MTPEGRMHGLFLGIDCGTQGSKALLLDAEAQAVEFNQAFLALLGERPREAWRAYLPANHGQLVRASLGQARALGEVEAECDG
ncbi:TPA: hypothetical protein ACOB6X_005942, partial [Pseudomonas aeruginosa]